MQFVLPTKEQNLTERHALQAVGYRNIMFGWTHFSALKSNSSSSKALRSYKLEKNPPRYDVDTVWQSMTQYAQYDVVWRSMHSMT